MLPQIPFDPAPDSPDPRDGEGSSQPESRSTSQRRQRSARTVPTRDECLQALAEIPGLVAMGLVTPAQANAMRPSYIAILQHLNAQPAAGPAFSNDKLREMLRRDPTLLSVFESLLTDEQIEMLTREED